MMGKIYAQARLVKVWLDKCASVGDADITLINQFRNLVTDDSALGQGLHRISVDWYQS